MNPGAGGPPDRESAGGSPVPHGSPAGLRRRLASLAYEVLLLAAVLLAAGFAVLPFTAPGTPGEPEILRPLAGGARVASFAWHLAVAGSYFVWMWSGGRRTLPMRTWHMHLETAGGAPLDAGRASARFAASTLGPALAVALHGLLAPIGLAGWAWLGLALNFAWALVDPDRAFLHDRLAGTRLVLDAVASDHPARVRSIAVEQAVEGTRRDRSAAAGHAGDRPRRDRGP